MTDTEKPDVEAPSEKTEKMWDRARDALERSREEITKITKVGKLKFDLTKLQRDRAALYRDLGEKTYTLLKEGSFNPNDVKDTLDGIDQVSERIESQSHTVRSTARTAKAEQKKKSSKKKS